MVLGAGGDGKSSFIRRILGEGFIDTHDITNACEVDTCEVDIANCDIAWKRITVQYRQILEEHITEGISAQMKTFCAKPIKHFSKEHCKRLNSTSESEPAKKKKKEEFGVQSDEMGGPNADPTAKVRLTEIHKGEKKTNKQNELPSARCVIRVWDYGGQRAFYLLHHIFLRRGCVCALIINLATPLHSFVPDDHIPFPSTENQQLKYWEQIVYWLKSILSRMKITETGDIQDNLILVGTHKDLLHEDPAEQEKLANEYFNELKKLLKQEGTLYLKLISGFWAVNNKGGDPYIFAQLRNAIMESMKKHCKWEEKRPIRWLNLEQKLHDLRQDKSLSYIDQHLVTYDKVAAHAKVFHINSLEDIEAFLEFHNLTADLTYYRGDVLGQYVIPEPQWLINVFRSLITVNKYYPQAFKYEEEVDELKDEGRLRTDGILLKKIWEAFIGKDTTGQIQTYLLALMAEFDLAIEYEENIYLIPSLLPMSPASAPAPTMSATTQPLLYRFHSTHQSYNEWKKRGKTTDHFLPNGLFQKLISQCSKLEGWLVSEERYQDSMEFLVNKAIVTLQAKSTWIKLSIFGLKDDENISEYQFAVSKCLNKLIDIYYPSLWYDFCMNPCESRGHACVVSSRRSSLGGTEHIMKCPQHKEVLKPDVIMKWFGRFTLSSFVILNSRLKSLLVVCLFSIIRVYCD